MNFLKPIKCYTIVERVTHCTVRQELKVFIVDNKITGYRIDWCNQSKGIQQGRLLRIALNYKHRVKQNVGRQNTK